MPLPLQPVLSPLTFTTLSIKADEALRLVSQLGAKSCLDVGSGGSHRFPFPTFTIDLKHPADYIGDFMMADVGKFDLVWCSHVLEHQPNVNLFLRKCISHVSADGWLCITVPPMKNEVVGGHLTVWNAGILLYNLVVAGLDCSKAKVKTYGYNVSVLVKKVEIDLPKLAMDFGDIETLSKYFPLKVRNGFDGRIEELNWSI